MTKFDFSQYHPLDHSIWTCQSFYGGPKQHFYLWWNYKRPEIAPWSWIGTLLCKLGRHDITPYWTKVKMEDLFDAPPTGYICRRYCGYPE